MWVIARLTPFFGLDGGAALGGGGAVGGFGALGGASAPGWQVGIAIALALVGFGLAASAAGLFFKAKTTVHPEAPEKATTLVVDGVYRFTRNPMYLGMLLVLLGWAVYLGNLLALVVAFVFVLYINRFQIRREEVALAANFGEAYVAYRTRVRRWL